MKLLPGQSTMMRERLAVEAVAMRSLDHEFGFLRAFSSPGYHQTLEGALGAVRARLKLARLQPAAGLVQSIATSYMAGDLLGRWHAVRDALGAEVQFVEQDRILPDAPASWSVPRQIEQAADYLWSKGVLTHAEFYALRDRYRGAGFTIAGEQEAGFLGLARDSLADSLKQGMTAEQAAAALNAKLAAAGYDPLRPWHAQLVAHMNFSQAYGAASWETLHNPRMAGLIPFFEYVTMHDGRVRPAHAAMHGYIAPRNAQIWRVWWPPNGWNCRCVVRGVGIRRAGIENISGDEPWPQYDGKAVYPDVANGVSFSGNPATWLKRQARKAA